MNLSVHLNILNFSFNFLRSFACRIFFLEYFPIKNLIILNKRKSFASENGIVEVKDGQTILVLNILGQLNSRQSTQEVSILFLHDAV